MSIIPGYLEKKPSEVIEFHFLLKKLLGKEQGIYALYKENNLYYVGKSVDLQRRLKQHLKDRHQDKWNKFSFFVVRDKRHISDLEALLIRINDPKGNRQKPNKGKNLEDEYESLIDEYQKKQKDRLLGKKNSSVNISRNEKIISIIATYKGTRYAAKYNYYDHTVCYNKKKFLSPSAAARAITNRYSNGLVFWKTKDKNNKLVPLKKVI